MRRSLPCLVILLLAPGCKRTPQTELAPFARDQHLTILATNDLHGGVETADGGIATFAGLVEATREGQKAKWGDAGGVLLLDGGDQFQGTLLSNVSEGSLVFRAYSQIGYDAVVPGNHDYDFGPIGWLVDQVPANTTPSTPAEGPRGALLRASAEASFPLLSANTWEKASLVDLDGDTVATESISGVGCRRADIDQLPGALPLSFAQARRPEFLKPWLIRTTAEGVRVALIGIDNPETPKTTTPANVSDLCFQDPREAYLNARQELEGQADVFIMVIHDGDSSNESSASTLIRGILDARGDAVDAVVAGHTHFIHNKKIDGVPVIQSGANGEKYGRIELTLPAGARRIDRTQTRSWAGMPVSLTKCGKDSDTFCTIDAETKRLRLDGVAPVPNPQIAALVGEARAELEPLAKRILGEVIEGPLTRDRISESALANVLTDALRALSGADVAFLNTGGLRADLPKGALDYETLFRTLPFANRAVLAGPMPWPKLRSLLERSIQTCGAFGALMQSGLRVEFSRQCGGAGGATDPRARLLHVETLSGEVLWDAATAVEVSAERSFTFATLDFLLAGGAGFDGFVGSPAIRDLGIFREALTELWLTTPLRARPLRDGRWKERSP